MEEAPQVQPGPITVAAHRGGVVLALGIMGLVVCGPLGIAAWVMGHGDLRAMREGRMDPDGLTTTKAGMICGIVATGFLAIGACGGCTLLGFMAFLAAANG